MDFWKNELRYGSRSLLRENFLTAGLINKLAAHEALSPEQLQLKAAHYLHRSLQAAIARLPYYRHISADFSVAEAPQVLREQFPIIDKQTLLANRQQLYPHGGAKRPWQSAGKTSGTTGTPLTIYRSAASVLMENAFIQRHWQWSGYRRGHVRATLRGDMVVGLAQQRPPFWFWNRYDRQLLLSSRHLNEACVDAIAERLDQTRPVMMQAYPSTAYTLASLLAKRGRRIEVPYLFTASEPLYPHQRELVVQQFGCRIMDMYGMAERVAFATECEFGELHLNPDYSHVEIVDEQGLPTSDFGTVVGTTFHNLAMPLVRYRLSDRTRWKPGQCACGRHFPMLERVTGKLEDVVRGGNGEVVSPSVLTFAFKGVDNIRKSQVAQVAPGRWEIRLVPDPNFGPSDRQQLIDNVHQLVDATVDVTVVLRDELPNTAAGKFRWVVNEMN